MENNIKVAWVHRALSWFYAVAGTGIIAAVVLSGGRLAEAAVFFAIPAAGLFALHHFTAKGAREKKKWAGTASCVIGVLMLTSFPLGALIGIYLLTNASDWKLADAPANAG